MFCPILTIGLELSFIVLTNNIILSIFYDLTEVNFLLLDPNGPLVVEVLPLIGVELALGMEKFSHSSDAIFLNMK